jgi:hypothetical protein
MVSGEHAPADRRESPMKRILAIGSIAALSIFGFAGSATAAPADAACFGQVHKTINTEGYAGFTNVGEVVQALGGGQAKNDAAKGIPCD